MFVARCVRNVGFLCWLSMLFACEEESTGKEVRVSVAGLDHAVKSSSAAVLAQAIDDANPEGAGAAAAPTYPTVEGFKVRLTNVLAIDIDGNEPTLFDWSDAPRELQIANGFSGAIEDTAELANGTYVGLSVGLEPSFSIMAWAHIDHDGDGTPERTVWTTPDGVVSSTDAPASTDDMEGYGYYHYPFLYRGSATSATHDTSTPAEFSYFNRPFELTDAPTVKDKDGKEVPAPDDYRIDVRVDTYQLVTAWDGTSPRGERFMGANHHGVPDTDFYPDGQPALALDYVPIIALFNEADALVETYEISGEPSFGVADTQLMTVFIDGGGQPIGARIRHRSWLDLNQYGGMFESADDSTFAFLVGDGELLYSRDPKNAQHRVAGWQRLMPNDAPVELSVEDGAACATSAGGCQAARKAYLRRAKR